jgi:uncharacterized Fe-S cluster-containing radical SAM superfamily protein
MALVQFAAVLRRTGGSIVENVRGGQTIRHPVSSGEHRVGVRFRVVVWSDPVVVAVADGEECFLDCDTDWRGYARPLPEGGYRRA